MIEYKYSGTGKYDNAWIHYDENNYLKLCAIFSFIGFALGSLFTFALLGGVILGTIILLFSLYSAMPNILNYDKYRGKIFLYDRYLTFSDCYVYYLSISHIERDDEKGLLVIKHFIGDKQEEIVIKQERFPTDARKDFKREANQKVKFEKVSKKIISHAKAANPDIEVIVKEVEKEVEHESA